MKSDVRLQGIVGPVFLWLALAIAGFGAGVSASIAVFFMFTLLLGYAVSAGIWGISGASASRELACAQARCGESLTVNIFVVRKVRHPFVWLVVRDHCQNMRTGKTAIFHTFYFPWLRRRFVIQYLFPAAERGEWLFTAIELVAGDFFGFVTLRKRFARPDGCLIAPEPLPVYVPVAGIGAQTAALPLAGPFLPDSAASTVRPYAIGDPISRIDWKASARTGLILTKMQDETDGQQLLVIVDAAEFGREGAKAADAFETCISMALGVSQAAEKSRLSVRLLCTDKHYRQDLMSISAAAQEWERRLAMAAPDKNASLSRTFAELLRICPVQAAVVLFTTRIDEETARAVALLERYQGIALSLVLIGDEPTISRRERQLLERIRNAGKERLVAVYSSGGKLRAVPGGVGIGNESAVRVGLC